MQHKPHEDVLVVPVVVQKGIGVVYAAIGCVRYSVIPGLAATQGAILVWTKQYCGVRILYGFLRFCLIKGSH
jgi:hypothetical protein